MNRRRWTSSGVVASVVLVTAGLVTGLLVQAARGHTDALVACRLIPEAARLEQVGMILHPNGLVGERYDRNRDGMVDVEVLSAVTGVRYNHETGSLVVEHEPRPMLWIVDVDFDGLPDVVYNDEGGEGKCQDIKLYRDLRQQQDPHRSATPAEPVGLRRVTGG